MNATNNDPAKPISRISTTNSLENSNKLGETILFVEDSDLLQRSTAVLLRRMGFTVLTADDGDEALTVWETNSDSIDILLTDIMMPNEPDGIELAKMLLAQKPSLKVLLCSGYPKVSFNGRIEQLGKVSFLAKPYELQEFISLVTSLKAAR